MRPIDADAIIQKIESMKKFQIDVDDVLELIDFAPTIETEPKWIPCSERLPKESGRYLVTLKGGAVETDSFSKVDNKWVYFNTQIAWFSRELPEPYKEEEK